MLIVHGFLAACFTQHDFRVEPILLLSTEVDARRPSRKAWMRVEAIWGSLFADPSAGVPALPVTAVTSFLK
ncbi:hypothetical protein [Arthrobacter bambusae]|uniref:Alpha/beta hydrolase n=1 Tax=Arthrobacter bambusae TaxID=1338426 RepID=A0AAW8DE66_9MICC|nr:hypothetical protein [Arthrobacter bambusae]MDP9904575.1 hypothetical protein [Arthrobacter bambusae]MDQ0129390.1 hypothetical protein [Arthrobacter bambusae]MDQ0180997.1 hypothetical protein [Arthrobacter bambusae]